MKLLYRDSRSKAVETLQKKKLTDTNLLKFLYYHFTVGTVAGVENELFQTLAIQEVVVLKFIWKRNAENFGTN